MSKKLSPSQRRQIISDYKNDFLRVYLRAKIHFSRNIMYYSADISVLFAEFYVLNSFLFVF